MTKAAVSHLPHPLARRIDRLARRAHAFHRFAHHPLCAAYGGETLRMGRRTRLCLGCTLSWTGAAAGTAAGAVFPQPSARALAAAFGVWSLLSLGWMAARVRGRGRQASKWQSRFLPLAAAGALLALGVRRGSASGAAAALGVAGLVALALWVYRQSGPDRSACAACPEHGRAHACSGLRPIVQRERAFQRLAGRWIQAALAAPAGRAPGR